MMDDREARFERPEQILMGRRPTSFSEEEVEADIAEALAAVRRAKATAKSDPDPPSPDPIR